jgi:hypothetical protein
MIKRLSLFVLLAAGPAAAADDPISVAARAQSAWLRGAATELTSLAATHAIWANSTAAPELYALAFVQFRSLQLAIGAKNERLASTVGDACVAAAGKAAAAARNEALAAEAWALQSTCHGYLATVGGTFAAIRNGRASGKSMEQAVKLDGRNARVLLVDALGLYFRPKIAGGDKPKACLRFRDAGAAFDRAGPSGTGLAPGFNWGAAEVHYWLGRCARDAGDGAAARREYEQALKLAPEFAGARRALAR